jgi:hypothetical protein
MNSLAEQFSAELIDSMFNGNPDIPVPLGENGSDYQRLAGVRYRLQTGLNGIDTTFYQPSSAFGGGTPIDLSTYSPSVGQQFTTAMNQYIMALKPTIIASNFLLVSRAMQALRSSAAPLLSVTQDNYGRTMANWAGTRWITPSLKHSVRQAWNFTNTADWVFPYEDVNGNYTPAATASNRYGTIWFLRSSSTDGFTGFSVTGMKPRGPEKLQLPYEGVGYAMRYGHGWGTLSTHCIGAMYGVKYG